jgi:TonB family protein
MGRGWLSLVIALLLMTRLMSAQEARPSTPSMRASSDFLCSAEPRVTPIPELWSTYPGELRSELIVKADGEVADAKVIKSTFPPGDTESAIKVLKTWQFEPATKNGKAVSLWMGVTLSFSKTSATLQFEFFYPDGQRGCIARGMPLQ